MQQSRRPVRSRSGLSQFFGSRLMILLIVAIIILVAVFVVRSSRATTPSTAAIRAAPTSTTKHGAHTARTVKGKSPAVPKTPTAGEARLQALHAQRKAYAAQIVPVMDRTTHIFDGAARAVALVSSNFDTLQQSCSYWGGRVEAAAGEYEGVPHPFVWYSPAGTLHHQVSGVYHYMLGAIQNCQEAVQATDSGASATAISQMAAAAQDLHNRENYARYLATH